MGMEEQSLMILSLKKFRKDVASEDGESAGGRDGSVVLERSELNTFHNCFGLSLLEETCWR